MAYAPEAPVGPVMGPTPENRPGASAEEIADTVLNTAQGLAQNPEDVLAGLLMAADRAVWKDGVMSPPEQQVVAAFFAQQQQKAMAAASGAMGGGPMGAPAEEGPAGPVQNEEISAVDAEGGVPREDAYL